jgi:hypothetical protein
VSFAAITLCVASQRVYCCRLFRYRLNPETFGYTLLSQLGTPIFILVPSAILYQTFSFVDLLHKQIGVRICNFVIKYEDMDWISLAQAE